VILDVTRWLIEPGCHDVGAKFIIGSVWGSSSR
jgi:hypothetical protein